MEATRLRLWEIVSELDEIGEAIAEADGELSPELERRLDLMEGALEQKVENIALFVRECGVNAEAASIEEQRLAAIRKHFERKASGLKNYLLFYMRRQGRTSVKTPRARVWEQQNGRPSIRWTGDPSTAPPAFQRVTTTVDTQAAYEEWKAGAELPDGFVVEVGTHLRIA